LRCAWMQACHLCDKAFPTALLSGEKCRVCRSARRKGKSAYGSVVPMPRSIVRARKK